MGILARLESKNSSPDWGTLERFLAWAFGGGVASSGIVVNPQTALQAATVYACVKVLAESVGMLPLMLLRASKDGSREVATDHPLFDLLHYQPNEFQTSVEFWEQIVISLCLRGNGYAFVNRTSTGRVVELLPLHPDMMRAEMGADYTLTYQAAMPDGTFKPFKPGEIFHVRGQTINGWMGISPIAYAREAIGLALAAEKFGGQLFRNGAKMGGTLEHPQKLSQEAYDRIKGSFDAAHSGENAHRTAILEEGMKFNKISMNAEEAQFLETRKYQRTEIAAIYRVPLHMIGDLERATFSNIEQQSLDFINSALMPWLRRIELAVRRDLLSEQDKKTLHPKHNITALLRGDATARKDFYASGIQWGWLRRNEARRMESELGHILNPIPELETPLQPLNMVPAGTPPPEPTAAAKALARIEELEHKAREKKEPGLHVTLNQEPVSVSVTPPAVTVNVPATKSEPQNVQIDVHVPAQAAPIVNNNNTVNVPESAPPVVNNTVNVPKQNPTPVVLEATLPPLNVVATLPARKTVTETRITRDESGSIVKSTAESTETDAEKP